MRCITGWPCGQDSFCKRRCHTRRHCSTSGSIQCGRHLENQKDAALREITIFLHIVSIANNTSSTLVMKNKIAPCLLSGMLMLATVLLNAQSKSDNAYDAKITAIISKLTIEEKIGLLHANGIFSTAGVERLGIPGLMTDDGPLGIREDVKEGWGPANLTTDSATFFPNGSALAATWNPELAYRYGHDMGEEARARKKYIILAPAFNIMRTPLCGRTYEYYSEDPFLNSRLAVAAVKGIQSQDIAACVKHFAVNNQEIERDRVSVEVDERTFAGDLFTGFQGFHNRRQCLDDHVGLQQIAWGVLL